MHLSTRVTQLTRVGKVLENRLKRLGIVTVADLLYYFPFRYEDYSQIKTIKELQEGEQVTIHGTLEHIASKRSPRKRILLTEAVIVDSSQERLRIIWFGQPFIAKVLKAGDEVFFSGKITSDMFGLQMVGPSYEKAAARTTHTARIVPLYPLTEGITQKQMRFLLSQIIGLSEKVDDWLPSEICEKAELRLLSDALKAIHFPESYDDLHAAEKRLKFDELFILQLRSEMVRRDIKRSAAPEISFQEERSKEFVQNLPFELTKDQKVAAWEILQDMQKKEPMNRLLEGDVGSGKTVVAAMALYNALLNNYQGVMMAPTEILASQHFESLQKLFSHLKIEIALLTRSKAEINDEQEAPKTLAGKRERVLEEMKQGRAQVIVGTHALLSDEVKFSNLGLVVIDEQHRFGVEQRKTIREKSGKKKYTPHFLSMTATPIPRSFALTLYGDLDLSIIKTKPSGRKPILTRFVDPHNREKAYEFIRKQIRDGRQVFVICPLIEEKKESGEDNRPSVVLQVQDEKKTVMKEFERLSQKVFPEYKAAFLHGKMQSKEKDEIMKSFAEGETHILVSTSVVEVGVNIPNASVMMIEGADKFGLAQLHQFRGRVGRSDHQSYCFLFSDSPSKKAKERLEFFEKTLDGFVLAEFDLQTRGPGEVYGTVQSGMMNFRLATLNDTELIKLARDLAREIDFDAFPELKKKVHEWEMKIHLE